MSLDSAPVYAIFDANKITDSAIKSYEVMRFPSETKPNTTGPNNTEFVINARNAGLDSMILPARAYVEVEYSLFATDQNAKIAGDKQQCITSGWHLFQQASFGFGSQDIEFVQECGVVAHVKNLVSHTDEHVRKQGPHRSYFPQENETAITALGNADPALAISATPNIQDRQLHKALRKHAYTAAQNAGDIPFPKIRVKLPLADVFGFCAIDKAYPAVDLRLRLVPEQTMAKVIFAGTGSTAAFVRISNVELYLPVLRPSNELMASLGKDAITGKKIPISFEHWNYYSVPIANAATSVSQIISTTAKRPSAVYVAMQTNDRLGALTTNKLSFDRQALTTHHLLVDGKQYPLQGYQGSLDDYQFEYEQYLQVSGKQTSNHVGPYLDVEQWKNVYPVVCYDLSAMRDEFGLVRNSSAVIQWNANLTAVASRAHVCVVDCQYRELSIVNGLVTITAPDYKE